MEESPRGGLPDLGDVLGDELLRHVFDMYLQSIFVPENMAFRDEVERYVALFDDGSPSLVRLLARRRQAETIMTRFCRSDSPCEIVIKGRTRARLKEELALGRPLEQDLFQAALADSDESLAACLPAFFRSQAFLAVWSNPELAQTLWDARSKLQSEGEPPVQEDQEPEEGEDTPGCCFASANRTRRRPVAEEREYEVHGWPEAVASADLATLWRVGVVHPLMRQNLQWVSFGTSTIAAKNIRVNGIDPTLVSVGYGDQ